MVFKNFLIGLGGVGIVGVGGYGIYSATRSNNKEEGVDNKDDVNETDGDASSSPVKTTDKDKAADVNPTPTSSPSTQQ